MARVLRGILHFSIVFFQKEKNEKEIYTSGIVADFGVFFAGGAGPTGRLERESGELPVLHEHGSPDRNGQHAEQCTQ